MVIQVFYKHQLGKFFLINPICLIKEMEQKKEKDAIKFNSVQLLSCV